MMKMASFFYYSDMMNDHHMPFLSMAFFVPDLSHETVSSSFKIGFCDPVNVSAAMAVGIDV